MRASVGRGLRAREGVRVEIYPHACGNWRGEMEGKNCYDLCMKHSFI